MPPGPSDLNSGAACHCCCPTIRVCGPIAKTGCPGLDFQTWKLDDSHPQLPTNLVMLGESRHSARSRSTCSCPPATDLDYVGSSGFQAAEIIRREQQGLWARTLHPIKTFRVLRMAQRAMNNCGGPSRALQPQKYLLPVRRSSSQNGWAVLLLFVCEAEVLSRHGKQIRICPDSIFDSRPLASEESECQGWQD